MSQPNAPTPDDPRARLLRDLQETPKTPVGPHLSDADLQRFATDDVTPEQSEAIEQHLASCDECGQRFENLAPPLEMPDIQTRLLGALTGPDASRRATAAKAVGALGSDASPDLLAELANRLDDPDAVVRAQAASALRQLAGGAPDHEIAPFAWQGAEGERRLEALRKRILNQPSLWERLNAALRSLVLLPDVSLPSGQMAYAASAQRPPQFGETDDGVLRWSIAADDEHAGGLIVRFASDELELEGAAVQLSAGTWQRQGQLQRVLPDQVGVEIVLSADERAALPVNSSLGVALQPRPE